MPAIDAAVITRGKASELPAMEGGSPDANARPTWAQRHSNHPDIYTQIADPWVRRLSRAQSS